MYENNSTTHVFRFVQMRPTAAVESDEVVLLGAESSFARKLIGSPPARRREMARAHAVQSQSAMEALLQAAWAQEILALAAELSAGEGTVGDFLEQAAGSLPDGNAEFADISDSLLAGKFGAASTLGFTQQLARLYRAMHILRNNSGNADAPLAVALRRTIVLPRALSRSGAGGARSPERAAPENGTPAAPASPKWHARVERAMKEIFSLFQAQATRELAQRRTGEAGSPVVRPALSEATAARMSHQSQDVLRSLSMDVTTRPIASLIAELESALVTPPLNAIGNSDGVAAVPPPSAPSALAEPQVRPSGVADLLIVKQHLLSYQRTDIAHVENVMSGEHREREHRLLERSEQTFTSEREQIDQKETELQTAERFELQQETQETIQRDQRLGFGLSVSGKYGPSVEFSSNLEAESSQSSEETARSALTYAKDVMERSLQRVTQRVREEQVRRLIRESEETNKHGFNNATTTHIVGTYQFLEKEYECQVFNYGIREMFDFMVPEPASYIWHLEQSPGSDLALPPAPPKLSDFIASASGLYSGNYLEIAAAVGARGLEPPPPILKFSTVSVKHGDSGDEGGRPQSVIEKEIPIPDGYVPWFATARQVALTDDDLTLAITLGTDTVVWSPRGSAMSDLSGLDLGTATETFVIATSLASQYDAQSKLPLQVTAYESNAYSVVVELQCARTEVAYEAWKIKTYDALAQAAREQQALYDQQVADLKARARADEAANAAARFDAPPSEHQRIIKAEFKKHCLSIVTRQWYSEPNGMLATDPPSFDLDVAATRGAFIRFFEQAFEWDQLQYVCYPYFWARQNTWGDRFRRTEVDPVFLEFLRAGAARVVVPVRPGFEAAILHFLETLEATGTGEIWNGSGEPPPIASPLYVSILREIQERTDAPLGEIAVGAPWKTQLPTPLAILRPDASLPRWQRASPDGWDWSEVP